MWYKDDYDELNKNMDSDNNIAYITPNGINRDHSSNHVLNGCGLTHKKFLDEICLINNGELPHGKFKGKDGFVPDKWVAINTEIEFTNILIRMGYDFKDILYDNEKKTRYSDSWYTAVNKIGIRGGNHGQKDNYK